ncbi:hypothetical protein [Ornithinimicrobium sp. CNJ-824]|nr:hypothetical protein [Ornithinimicrobium sp. CNJ-824]
MSTAPPPPPLPGDRPSEPRQGQEWAPTRSGQVPVEGESAR